MPVPKVSGFSIQACSFISPPATSPTGIAEYLLKRDLGLYAFEKVGYRNIPIGFSDSPLIGKQMFLSSAKVGVYAVGVMTGYTKTSGSNYDYYTYGPWSEVKNVKTE